MSFEFVKVFIGKFSKFCMNILQHTLRTKYHITHILFCAQLLLCCFKSQLQREEYGQYKFYFFRNYISNEMLPSSAKAQLQLNWAEA